MIANIVESENYVVYFDKRILSGLSVDTVGYNNFKFIAGCKVMRKEEHFTMHFILSGKGTFNIGGKSFRLGKGDVFYCAPNELFSYYPDESDPWEYVWFGLYGDNVSETLRLAGLDSEIHVRYGVVTDAVINRLDGFLSGADKSVNRGSLAAVSAFTGILSEIAIEDEQPPKQENMTRRYVKRAKNCIENNFTDSEFRIEHIGQLLFLNHTYLCRLFLRETGVTMVAYLRECRIDAAKNMLTSTDKTVREISLDCGFSDYPHFCKIFLSETGFTPSSWRENQKNLL